MTPTQAYTQIKQAVKYGRIFAPETCTRCGLKPKPTSDGRRAIYAHHEDYSKPLEVEWLCARCHRAITPLPRGQRNGAVRLTAAQVLSARIMVSDGASIQSIADRMGVERTTLSKAVRGVTWGYLAARSKPTGEV